MSTQQQQQQQQHRTNKSNENGVCRNQTVLLEFPYTTTTLSYYIYIYIYIYMIPLVHHSTIHTFLVLVSFVTIVIHSLLDVNGQDDGSSIKSAHFIACYSWGSLNRLVVSRITAACFIRGLDWRIRTRPSLPEYVFVPVKVRIGTTVDGFLMKRRMQIYTTNTLWFWRRPRVFNGYKRYANNDQ